MEKVIYVVWRDPRVKPETFAYELRTSLAQQLLQLAPAAYRSTCQTRTWRPPQPCGK